MVSDREKVIISVHEVGHAMVLKYIPDSDPVHRISVISRGRTLGYTLPVPQEDRYLMTRKQLISKICGLLGGRVAEEEVLSEITTGAENDLEQATEIARRMVVEFGMSKKLGPINYAEKDGMVFLGRDLVKERGMSQEVASIIDEEIRSIIDECYESVQKIIGERKKLIVEVARVLREKEVLTGEEFDELINNNKTYV